MRGTITWRFKVLHLDSTTLGTFGRAASIVALIYLLGLIVLLFFQETKDDAFLASS